MAINHNKMKTISHQIKLIEPSDNKVEEIKLAQRKLGNRTNKPTIIASLIDKYFEIQKISIEVKNEKLFCKEIKKIINGSI